ncbi:MFS transporter [Nocardioides pantholopis]|uniref:MFS transporter n=1 Tax=Nocardioides pantholopis TaxID=2483798 RepID=UPI000FDB41A9|nr:MFS transporter [Nocardioides pantholopis]
MSARPDPRLGKALAVWVTGLLVYVLAVFHRSSLAVAGLAASERFDISASQLATFTMLQLLVYALMQIPVGLAVDRIGPRRVLLTGLSVMTLGQLLFAFAGSYPLAVLARVLVGCGDAMVFICVLRLVATWFPARRVPLFTQLTGMLGQLGAILAAAPMTWALSTLGWTRAYAVAAALGLAVGVAAFLLVRDSPEGRPAPAGRLDLRDLGRGLAESWRHPGTRLGFWIHFSTPFSANVLSMLWGYPFFVRGEGRSSAEAGLLLTIMVVAVIAAGPVLGWLVGRHPWHRSTMVLAILAAIVSVWTVVLLWPGEAPFGVLVLLVVVAGVGGPASVIGFDVGRTSNPPHRQSSATGVINQAGFYATLLLVVVIGLVLDWRTPEGSGYTQEAFRWAMATQYVLWGIGIVQIVRYRVRTRRVVDRAALQSGVTA